MPTYTYRCMKDFFWDPDKKSDQCTECPENAICDGPGRSLPIPENGFWSDHSDVSLAKYIYPCQTQTCLGSDTANGSKCASSETYELDTCKDILCAKASSGRLCSECEYVWLLLRVCVYACMRVCVYMGGWVGGGWSMGFDM